MTKLLCVLACFPIWVLAQQADQEMKFERGLSWQQVKEKAKSQNKYIFIDCYTTWCSPCKAMDKDVFSDKSVADLFNDKFVSFKLQMDKSDKDDDEVKKAILT